ncbi:MAG: phosphatidate cytidylyltransferase [Treponema sp.]|nr:phosphatidate cytidylyltransferase [Treponema sp.]
MNKVAKRLLVFFIGIPIIIGITTLDYYNHIALNILAIFASAFAAHEFYNMAKLKFKMFPKTIVIILTALLPFLAYNSILIDMDFSNLSWFLVLEIFLFMGAESLIAKDFEQSVVKIAITVLILFYCGFMITFITRMTAIKENASIFLYLYFILVFMTDSGAWFFGVLFGKSTRGFFKASPNKSIVGFFGGIITAIACGIVFKFIFPTVFFGSIWKIVLVSFGTSLAAIIGDLIESVFKRSFGVKDSGTIIPGRGGLLDCLDSLILGAPIFYIGIHFLFLTAKI